MASSSTSRPTIFGLFDRSASPMQEIDIEAQIASVPAPPSPARTTPPRATRISVEETTNAIDDFFGAPSHPSRCALAGTRDSRHDELRLSIPTDTESLPAYEQVVEPPVYTQVSDQPTLAMYLFKFGFLFPLFWVAGAFILLSPLRAPADWEQAKPEVERAEIIESMRRTEVRWAKRCLYALVVFVLVVAAVVLGALLAKRD